MLVLNLNSTSVFGKTDFYLRITVQVFVIYLPNLTRNNDNKINDLPISDHSLLSIYKNTFELILL